MSRVAARFQPFRTRFWRGSPYESMRRHFNHALEPLFQRLGIARQPSPISVALIVYLAFLAAVATAVPWLLSGLDP